MPVPSYTQIRGKEPVWLLQIDLGGDVRRYASRQITTSDGILYVGGLSVSDVTIDRGLDRAGITITDTAETWARYEARGGELDSRVAVLSLWWDGMSEAQAYGVLKGRTSGSTVGYLGQPGVLKCSLSGSDLDSITPFPPAQRTVDRTTFVWDPGTERFDPESEGTVWPIVVGYPGTGEPDEDDATPPGVYGVPLVRINEVSSSGHYVLIALGQIDADMVRLMDIGEEQGTTTWLARTSDLAVSSQQDELGVTYSYVELDATPGSTGVRPREGSEYLVSFRNTSGWGGGILNRTRSGPIRGLGEVISYCLEQSGLQADLGRQEAERGRLDRFHIDGLLCGGEKGRVDLSRLVMDDLGKLFPIRRMRSADGVWYRYQTWRPAQSDAIAYLSTERNDVARASEVKKVHGKFNVFTLRFRLAHKHTAAVRILGPDHETLEPYTGADERVLGSPICKASEALYGRREAPEVDTDLIWSYRTAAAVLHEWAARDALPYRKVSYDGVNLEWLLPGDVIAITDPEIGLTDRVAIVDSVTVGGPLTRLALVLPYSGQVLTS